MNCPVTPAATSESIPPATEIVRTGWLVPPCILHAPGSLVTYEPQWGSDVFGMYQSLVEGRPVPWELLVKDVPKEYHQDLDYLVEQLPPVESWGTYFVTSPLATRSGGDTFRFLASADQTKPHFFRRSSMNPLRRSHQVVQIQR